MVRLSTDLIVKLSINHNKRKSDESVTQYLSRITHLYLQSKSIDDLVSLWIESELDFDDLKRVYLRITKFAGFQLAFKIQKFLFLD